MMRFILCFLYFVLMAGVQISGSDTSRSSSNRELIVQVIESLGLAGKVSQEDIVQLTDLKTRAESSTLNEQERLRAYMSLFTQMSRLESGNSQQAFLDGMAKIAVSWSPGIQKKQELIPPGQLAFVEKQGTGKIQVILIPDIGYSWDVFQSFVQRNASQFEMYALTLPGFCGAGLPPVPERRDFTQTPLWKNAETAVVNLIETRKLKKPVLVGHQAGAYLAMKLALNHPDMVGSVVVLNGLLYAPMPSGTDPSKQASSEERAERINKSLPIELFPNPSQTQYKKYLEPFAPMLCKDPQRQQFLLQILSSSDAHNWWSYYIELMSTDLSNPIKTLKVPMLVIPSVPDKELPGREAFNVSLTQWQDLKLPMITVTPFENTRAFATEDSPRQLDEAISNFVNRQN